MANLIFVEHERLLIENSLLVEQISNYKTENSLLVKADSVREAQILNYEDLSKSYNLQIDNLNKRLKAKDDTILRLKVGGVTISAGLLLILLLK